MRYWLTRLFALGLLSSIALGLILSSSWGLKHLVLPLASHFLNGSIKVDKIEFSKRHSLELSNLQLSLPGVLEARLPYGSIDLAFLKLFKKELLITSATLNSLHLELKEGKGGEPQGQHPAEKPDHKQPTTLPVITLKNTKIRHADISMRSASGLKLDLNNVNLGFLVCGTGIACDTNGSLEVHYEKLNSDPTVLAERIDGKISIKGTATLSRKMEIEDYTLHASLEPLDVLQFPVRFENGRAALTLKGKHPTDSENTLDFLWRNLSVPGTILPSEGMLKASITFTPKKSVRFSNVLFQLYEKSEAYADMTTEGSFEFENRQLNADLKVLHLDDRVLKLLPAKTGVLQGFSLNGEFAPRLAFGSELKGEMTGKVHLNSLEIREPKIEPQTLRGSSLEFSAMVLGQSVSLRSFSVLISKDQRKIVDLSGEGQTSLPGNFQAKMQSSVFDLDEIKKLAGVGSEKTAPKQQATTPAAVEERENTEDTEIRLPNLPGLNIHYDIQNFHSESIPFSSFQIALNNPEANTGSEPLHLDVHANSGSGSVHVSLRAKQLAANGHGYEMDLDTANFPLRDLLGGEHDKTSGAGTVDKLRMHFTGSGLRLSELKHSLRGRAELLATKASLPSKFQDIPPFNLIFLPLDVVANIADKTTGFLLPKDLMSTASGLRSELSEQGRLRLKKVELQIDIQDELVKLSRGSVNPNLLPGIEYTGTIGLDGDLDLRAFISILGIRVPLPIAGTLDTPLPNVIRFVPELIRGLGLSALDVVSEVIPSSDETLPLPDDSQSSEGRPERTQGPQTKEKE